MAVAAMRFFKFTVSSEEQLYQGDSRVSHLVTNYDISFGCRYAFIGRLVCYLMTSFIAIHFFYGTHIISPEHLKRSILSRVLCLLYKTNCSHPLYKVSCGKYKAIKGYCVYLRKTIAALLFLKYLFVPQN